MKPYVFMYITTNYMQESWSREKIILVLNDVSLRPISLFVFNAQAVTALEQAKRSFLPIFRDGKKIRECY